MARPEIAAGGDVRTEARSLVAIMRRTPSVLFWADEGRISCVADPAVIPHMPLDMLDAVGEPFIVSNGQEIIRAITRR